MILQKSKLDSYRQNPGRVSSLPYWKSRIMNVPDSLKIIHKKDLKDIDLNKYQKQVFFKLVHHLHNIGDVVLPNSFYLRTVNKDYELRNVVSLINECYCDITVDMKKIIAMQEEPAYDKSLWVFILDRANCRPVALGIADFDPEVKEGSLEWIQVLPQYRGLGLGKAIVCELLTRLEKKADFVTVSGQIENHTKPEELYRSCGFEGDDIWYVLREKRIAAHA